jgi:hypothetical protein
MFSLTGDSDEWIGYILFSNEDRINSYYQEAYHQTRILLEKYKNKYLNLNNKRELERLTNLILNSNNINDIRLILEKLKSPLTELDQAIINSMLIDYNNKMDQFLNQLPEYFYLDVVIALPKDEEINLKYENKNTDINYLVESKYYGFIGESLSLANELIKDNFMDIPILLRNNDNFIEVNKVYKKK